jgi:MoxR-like ATPase
VLLIDEIDKTDQEFEAMLLELLSDFQITIPELGRIEASSQPIVVLTSNNSRELTEALKRRCLYLWLDYPTLEHELEIVRLHAPELAETVARKLVEVIAMVRELDLKKPPSIAESIDWARALLLLGARDIDELTFAQTMSVIVKHRTDLELVAERVGIALALRLRRRERPPGAAGIDARLLELGEELRAEGVAIGTSELLDAFAALAEVDWTERERFQRRSRRRSQSRRRTAASSTSSSSASSSARSRPRALREGVKERAGRTAATDTPRGSASTSTSCARQIAQALADFDEARMRDLARLAIAALGRRPAPARACSASTCSASAARSAAQRPTAAAFSPATRATRAAARGAAALRGDAAARARAGADRAHRDARRRARSASSTARCRAARRPTSPRCTASSPSFAAASRRTAASCAAAAATTTSTSAHDARLAADRRRPGRHQTAPAAPAAPRDLRPLRRLDQRHLGLGLLPLGAARAPRLVPPHALVRVHRARLRGDRRVRPRARVQGGQRAIAATPASPTSPATPTTDASGRSSASLSRTTSTRAPT